MTSANEQQHEQGTTQDEPTEVAETLHGKQARAEEHEQPDAVTMTGDTLVAKREPLDDEAE